MMISTIYQSQDY